MAKTVTERLSMRVQSLGLEGRVVWLNTANEYGPQGFYLNLGWTKFNEKYGPKLTSEVGLFMGSSGKEADSVIEIQEFKEYVHFYRTMMDYAEKVDFGRHKGEE